MLGKKVNAIPMRRASYLATILLALSAAFGPLLIWCASSLAQASRPPDLTLIEKNIANQLTQVRKTAGLKALKIRRDLRMRMEACSIQIKGPDPIVAWYLTADPEKPNDALTRLAKSNSNHDHVAVGVWFAATQQYPSGMYWIVVYDEDGAAKEAFWSHFYLTDAFEYETYFNKQWKRGLPQECRAIQ